MSFEDKTLVCRDCGAAFTFTAGEQEFYAQKGFTNEPMRCRDCRQARKQQRGGSSSNDRSSSGGNYRSEGYDRGGDDYGGGYSRGNDYGGRSGDQHYSRGSNIRNGYGGGNDYGSGGYGNDAHAPRERVQHETVCAQCGRPTVVPFVPRSGRPVYCQECFADRRGPGSSRGAGRDSGYNRF